MKITTLALALAASTAMTGAADAALITRSYTTTSTYLVDADGSKPPYLTVVQDYTLTFDPMDAQSAFTLTDYSSKTGGIFSIFPGDVTRVFNATNNFLLSGSSAEGSSYFIAVLFDIYGNPIDGDPADNAGISANYDYFDSGFNRISFIASTVKTTIALPNITINPGTPAVPEPATWAMMLVGFGMIGATARYRRKARTVLFA